MQAVKRVSAGNLSIQVYIWGKTKMDISYDYYRTFYYVAKYKSFTGAAEALLNSQPNITRTMKKLEKELGCTLFVRQRHGIALTPEGEKLYAHISVAFEHISYGEQEIARDKSLQSGIVTIAASEIALHCILLPTLKKFRNTYPGIHIRILTHSTPQAMDMLKRGLADFAIVTEPFEFISGFSFRILRSIQEVPVCSSVFSLLPERPLQTSRSKNIPSSVLVKRQVPLPFTPTILTEGAVPLPRRSKQRLLTRSCLWYSLTLGSVLFQRIFWKKKIWKI